MRVALGMLGIGVVAGSALFVACGGGDTENLFNPTGTGGTAGSTGGSGQGGSAEGGSSGQGGSAKGGASGQGGTAQGGAGGNAGGAGTGGTAGTGGVGGASGGGSGGSGGTAGTGGGVDACAVQSLPVARVDSETYLVFDRSGSMSDGAGSGTKWTELRTALNAFFAEPESAPLIFGVTPMPPVDNNTNQCDPMMYEKPPVIPGVLGQGKSTEIATYLQPLNPDGTSPWSAAFTGAIEFAKSRATANPDRNVTVLLAGDAPATDCDVAMANIQAILAAGQSGTPSIRMYVIGLLVGGVAQDVTDMNSLASASGTYPPWLPNPPASSNIVSALHEYRDRVACDVTLPLVQGAPPDPAKTTFEVQSGASTVVSHVADAASCAGNAWYNIDPLRGRLCPQVCKTVLASPSAKMVIKTSCP